MNTNDKQHQTETEAALPEASCSDTSQPNSRRKLLKKAGLLAVPLVTTLASRPVLAWHCRTPSMWGSMAMNPATSLMKHTDHTTGVIDESWFVANWAGNSGRSNLGKPWDKLLENAPLVNGIPYNRPAIYLTTKPASGTITVVASASKKTFYVLKNSYLVSDFCSDMKISCNATGSLGQLFSNSSSFDAHIVVAQLNEILLSTVRQCVDKQIDLAAVAKANGVFKINNVQWTPEMFIDYFEANYIAVANTTSQNNWSSNLKNNSVNSNIQQGIFESPKSQDRHWFSFK